MSPDTVFELHDFKGTVWDVDQSCFGVAAIDRDEVVEKNLIFGEIEIE